jgi:hypothetical protein
LCLYLALLYGVSYFVLRPEGLPSVGVQLLTLVCPRAGSPRHDHESRGSREIKPAGGKKNALDDPNPCVY